MNEWVEVHLCTRNISSIFYHLIFPLFSSWRYLFFFAPLLLLALRMHAYMHSGSLSHQERKTENKYLDVLYYAMHYEMAFFLIIKLGVGGVEWENAACTWGRKRGREERVCNVDEVE